MNNLFICHRPYQYLVAAALSRSLHDHGVLSRNMCVVFDMYSRAGPRPGEPGALYSDYRHILDHEEVFDRTEFRTRVGESRIWNLRRFKDYYRRTVADFSRLLDTLGPSENVFFFSDREKPVEILVSLAKKKHGSRTVLIDEGVVSYECRRSMAKAMLKRFVVRLSRFEHVARSHDYGGSHLFDTFLTYDKDAVSVPAARIEEMAPPSLSALKPFLRAAPIEHSMSTVLYISSALGEGAISREQDFALIEHICALWREEGCRVLLKEHPLEPAGKFGALASVPNLEVYPDRMVPTEVLFEDAAFITGINSSSLLSAARFGQKPVLSYINYLPPEVRSRLEILEAHGITCPIDNDDHARSVATLRAAKIEGAGSDKPKFHELAWLERT